MAEDDKKTDDIVDEETKNDEIVMPEEPVTKMSDEEPVDEVSDETEEPSDPKRPNIFKRFWASYKARKKIAVPLTVLILLLTLFAIPVTRYAVLGLVMKKNVLLYTIDSQSKAIIYNTKVTLDGKQPGCGSSKPPYPNCFSKISVGKHKLKIEAGNYKSIETTVMVGLGKSKDQNVEIPMVATGRMVAFRISNIINGQAIADVRVKSGSSETATNERGDGSIVIDPSHTSVDVEISREGFNVLKTKVKINNQDNNFNQISLTPNGKIYFLSKKTGKIDVVKTDLDGSNRTVVLAGTGQEEDTNTVLLASRDWKYLALLARREGDKSRLYLIETSNDKLTEIDSGDASFTLAGWHEHNFAYTVYRNNVPVWQPKKAAVKTYNADNKQLTVVDETNAEGSGDSEYAGEVLGSVYILKDGLIYTKHWYASYYSVYRLAGKRMSIYKVKPNGTDKQLLKDFDVGNSGYISAAVYEPEEIYFAVYNATTNYYEYHDGKVVDAKDVTADSFNKFYPTYLLSPSGQSTFWYEPRDGKNTLFTGNQAGENAKEIASLSEYIPYGWYGDDYLLVSKDGSELYILPVSGPVDKGQILKVTDYHKPSASFTGYGYGYGGF